MPCQSTTNAQPPSYEQSQNTEGLFPNIEEAWDAAFQDKDFARATKVNVAFQYRPPPPENPKPNFLRRVFQQHDLQPEWRAFLRIKSKNIPRLMKTGFSWSPANIVPGYDMIVDKKKEEFRPQHLRSCYQHHRQYWIQEKPEAPEWNGWLHVFSKTFSTVAHFNVDRITSDLLVAAHCWDLQGGLAYHYDTDDCHEAFNTIYPGPLLGGSWPWPRAEEGEEDDGDESGGGMKQDQAPVEAPQKQPSQSCPTGKKRPALSEKKYNY